MTRPADIVSPVSGRSYRWEELDPARAYMGATRGLLGPHGSAFLVRGTRLIACGLWSGLYPESLPSVEREIVSIERAGNNRDSDNLISRATFNGWLAEEAR